MRKICILLFIGFINCQSQIDKTPDKKTTDFEKFNYLIPILKTPVLIRSGELYSFEIQRKKDIELFGKLDELYFDYKKKFFPSDAFNSIDGRLFPDKKFASIIFRCDAEIICPVLYTFSKNGKIIDSLALYNYIGTGFGCDEVSYALIDSKMNIVLTDTAKFFEADTNGIKPTFDYRIIKCEKFLLGDNGKFQKKYEKRDSIKY